jgi:hypothetical protein
MMVELVGASFGMGVSMAEPVGVGRHEACGYHDHAGGGATGTSLPRILTLARFDRDGGERTSEAVWVSYRLRLNDICATPEGPHVDRYQATVFKEIKY